MNTGDKPQDACGVFGVYGPGHDVARITYFGLFTLQHRGQESAGIAVSNGDEVYEHKQMGLVNQIFDESVLARLRGHIAIGHVRYSTTGSSVIRNAQPILVGTQHGEMTLALAHNGNLTNAADLRAGLVQDGVRFNSTSDTEVIARLLLRELFPAGAIESALSAVMPHLAGAYSLVVLTQDELIAARDPYGLHPLCVGQLDEGSYVVSSETCALHTVGAKLIRELEPGEAVIVDKDGLRFHRAVPMARPAMCIFETVYFARPDSVIYGHSLHGTRRRMGQQLAHEHPVDADVVIACPDTGTPGAIGFSDVSGIPFDIGLVKTRYIGRTFIQPDQRLRDMGARLKYTPLHETLDGKRVVVVDDSIVRGTTTRRLVGLLREAGAAEVHLRICSPPIQWPCFYGIAMATREELIASSHSVEEIRDHIGADSLGYLSVEGLAAAEGKDAKGFCWACLTGDYPIPIPDKLRRGEADNSCGGRVIEKAPEPEPAVVKVPSLFDELDDEGPFSDDED